MIQVDQFTSPDIFLKHQISIHLVPYQEALKHFLLKLPLTGDLLLPNYAGPEKIIFWVIDFTLQTIVLLRAALLPQIVFIQYVFRLISFYKQLLGCCNTLTL